MTKLEQNEIDVLVYRKTEGMSKRDAHILRAVSEETWFRQYASKSKKQTDKLIKKVKDGIKHGKYGDSYADKPLTGGFDFIKPTPKGKEVTKKKKKVAKKGKKKNVTTPKETSDKGRKYTPQTKSRVESARLKYPDASNFELRHGVNSKASQEYRVRNNRPKKYEGRIIG